MSEPSEIQQLARLLKSAGMDIDTALTISIRLRRPGNTQEMITWLENNPTASNKEICVKTREISTHARYDKDIIEPFARFQINGGISKDTDRDQKYTIDVGKELILSKLQKIGTPSGLVMGAMMMLEDNIGDDEDEEAVITQRQNRLLQYMVFKGEHLSSGDVTLKLMQFVKENTESYLPNYMLLQYMGETTEELIHGDFYYAYVVYGLDEEYLVTNETGRDEIYSCHVFRRVRATKIRFDGYDDDSDRATKEGTLISGQEYEVTEVKIRGLTHYRCSAGSCYPEECLVLEAEPVPQIVEKKPFSKPQLPLTLIGKAIEFGSVRDLYNRLSDDCIYISENSGKTIQGALEIAHFFQQVGQAQFEQNIFCDTAVVTITKSEPGNRYPVGTECLTIRYSDDGQRVFVFAEHDDAEIYRIVISCENYGFSEIKQSERNN